VIIGFLLAATRVFADVSVVASVDRNRIGFGESAVLTITVQGSQGATPPIPSVDGLSFSAPSTSSSMSLNNTALSQSISFIYQVTPSRIGEFTIPAIEVNVGTKKYVTEPVMVTVQKNTPQEDLKDKLYGQVVFGAKEAYVGQILPIEIQVFVRDGVPLKDLGLPQCETEGLSYQFRGDRRLAETTIDGVRFKVVRTYGAATFSRSGKLNLGSCSLKGVLQFQRQPRSWVEEMTGGNVENREISVPVDGVLIDVLPLPVEGQPADFSGAVGQWKLEVMAKPTEVAVGDPITFTIKISGSGNIDTVPTPKLGGLDEFKTYEPTTKTTKDELNTTGERVVQQVLIARSPEVKQLPEVRLVYFDPVAKAYKTADQAPMKLVVKAGSASQSTIVSGGNRLRPEEKLGQDIVYLKGDLGAVVPAAPFCTTPTFWTLNTMPVLALLGGIGWKKRMDKLRGDVAYARRVRAAREARKLLVAATNYDEVQHALQNYLGDRLNIPAAGITASIVEEQFLPREVDSELAANLQECFETCDTARFAGGSAGTTLAATREKVERLIDELEKIHL